jgi:hypothetical protein
MRIVANERHIHVRRLIGKFMPLAGLVALVAGLVVSYTVPEQFAVTMGAMVLGIILSLVGGFFSDRYAGPLAHHEALATALKGLDNHYVLLDYALPAPHVLLEPGGLTILLVKTHGGQVAYAKESGRWKHRQRGKVFRQLAGQESIGSPDVEAEHQAKRLAAWLANRLPDTEVPVRAAIVFVNPNVEQGVAARTGQAQAAARFCMSPVGIGSGCRGRITVEPEGDHRLGNTPASLSQAVAADRHYPLSHPFPFLQD